LKIKKKWYFSLKSNPKPMNKNILIGSFMLLSIASIQVNAQNQKKADCYTDYISVFEDRKAIPVTNGTQEIVVTIRKENGEADCYIGKVDVLNSKIVLPVYLQNVDGEFVPVKAELHKHYADKTNDVNVDLTIKDGMTNTFRTEKNDLINIFFVKSLKPKGKAYKKAPAAETY
jgi:hypothetical protein